MCARYQDFLARIQKDSDQSQDYLWPGRNRKRDSMLKFLNFEISALTSHTASQISDGFPFMSEEINFKFIKRLWTFVCLHLKGILSEDFYIKSVLLGSDITAFIIPNIVEHKGSHSYELVVA